MTQLCLRGGNRQHQFALHALVVPPEPFDLLLCMLAVPVDAPVVVVQRCDLLLCCLKPPNETMNGGGARITLRAATVPSADCRAWKTQSNV